MKRMRIVLLVLAVLLIPTAAFADYAAEVLVDGPTAYWQFEDAACTDGSAAADASGVDRAQGPV